MNKIHSEGETPFVCDKESPNKKIPYDPYLSPPDFSFARSHAQAARICKPSSSKTDDEKCPCCGLVINNVQFPLNTNLNSIAHLGITFPLYFQFIKKCSVLLIAQLILSSFYNFYLNALGTNCEQYSSFVCYMSVVNLYDNSGYVKTFESLSNYVTLIIIIIIIELFRVQQQISIYAIEKHKITPSDFTIQITGFSNDVRGLREYIQCHFEEHIVDIKGIYLLLDMEQYSKKFKQKLGMIDQLNFLKYQQRQYIITDDTKIQEEQFKLSKINLELDEFELKLQQFVYHTREQIVQTEKTQHIHDFLINNSNYTRFSGRILITLNFSRDATKLINLFKLTKFQKIKYWLYRRNIFKDYCYRNLQQFQYKNNIIRIKRAAEPSDINWMNVGSNKIHEKIWIQISVFIILIISGTSLSFLKLNIKRKTEDFDEILGTLISLVVSSVVALTNTIIGMIIRNFAGLETHKKQTNYFVSVAKRLSYLYFINMVVTTIISNLAVRSRDSISSHYKMIQMLNDFFFLFITNTYLSSLFNYFDIVWGFRLYRRYKVETQDSQVSQRELNQLYEGHPVDMALRYANVLKLMFFTGAVSPLLPIGVPLGIIGLFILYWVDKYLLLRRYVSKNYLDQQLANEMIDTLPIYVQLFSLGNQMIYLMQNDDNIFANEIELDSHFYLALSGVIIALIYRFVFRFADFRRFYHSLFEIKVPKKKINGSYDQYKEFFRDSYEQYHPVLKESQVEQQSTRMPRLLTHIQNNIQQYQ